MQKNSIITVLVFLTILFAQCSNKKNVHDELLKIAIKENLSAPYQYDPHTIFVKAEVADDNTFKYIYQIVNTPNPDSLINASIDEARARIIDAYKSEPTYLTLNELDIEFIYTDSTGQTLNTIKITPKDYK